MAALILVAVGVAAVPTHQRLTSQTDDAISDPIRGREGAWADHSSDLKHPFDGKRARDFTHHHSMRGLLPADPALERRTRAHSQIEGYLKMIARDVDALGMNLAPPRTHGERLSRGSASLEKREKPIETLVYEPGELVQPGGKLLISGFTGDLRVFNGEYGPRTKMKSSPAVAVASFALGARTTPDGPSPSDPYYYFQTGQGPGLLFYKVGHQSDEEEDRRDEEGEAHGLSAGRWYFMDNRLDHQHHGYLYELEDDGGDGLPEDGRWKPQDSDPEEGTPIWTILEDKNMLPAYKVPEPDEFSVLSMP